MSQHFSPQDYQLSASVAQRVKFNSAGLVPAVAVSTQGEVLMLAWMDEHALAHTLQTRKATYFSRSRQAYWVKGETSGNLQKVRSLSLDCDGDTVLVVVEQTGGACHTGDRTCFDACVLLEPEVEGDSACG